MVEQLREGGYLYKEQVAWDIKRLLGKSFVYDNENGNPAKNRVYLNKRAGFRRAPNRRAKLQKFFEESR